mgnify:CR=1 FL=1
MRRIFLRSIGVLPVLFAILTAKAALASCGSANCFLVTGTDDDHAVGAAGNGAHGQVLRDVAATASGKVNSAMNSLNSKKISCSSGALARKYSRTPPLTR